MKNEMKKKNNKGFSLVELIVVIAIMAVLMVVLAPAMLRYVEKTRVQKDDSAASEARNALELTLADDKTCSELNYAKVTLQVKGSDGSITVSPDIKHGGSSQDYILKEIAATTKATSNKISIVSKKRKGQTYTVEAVWKDDMSCYVLSEGTWASTTP